MSDNEIDVAIAEAVCRCKGVGNEKACNWNCPCANPIMSGSCDCRRLYSTDLNAMHEAEAALKPELFTIYDDRLNQSVFDDFGPMMPKEDPYHQLNRWKFHATAKQRARAFLKTIGKWVEEQLK